MNDDKITQFITHKYVNRLWYKDIERIPDMDIKNTDDKVKCCSMCIVSIY